MIERLHIVIEPGNPDLPGYMVLRVRVDRWPDRPLVVQEIFHADGFESLFDAMMMAAARQIKAMAAAERPDQD